MSQLHAMTLDDGTVIYIQATSDSAARPATGDDPLDFMTDSPAEDTTRSLLSPLKHLSDSTQGQALKHTIQGYTKQIIQSFREMSLAEVTEINLEFGVNIGAEAGIPYIANGSTDCNIKISVKCEFPRSK